MALLCAPNAMSEGQRRVAVLTPDEELLRAVSLALSPWGVETIASNTPAPEPSQPEAARMASHVALELGVEAVVWITSTERGSLLWVFDARAGDVTTRLLAESPPFDGAAAAAVALSVKTVLRSSVVAPPAERFGAEPVAPNPDGGAFMLELGAGVHFVAAQAIEPTIELAATAWLAVERRFGVGLELSAGPGVRIDDPLYRGYYRELAAGGRTRFRVIHEPSIALVVSLGGALHFTRLDGTLLETSDESAVNRINGSLDAEISSSVSIGTATYLGVSAGAAYFPTYRRYLVEGQPVFSPWRFAPSVGVFFGAESF
jgi:hypothetical protein